MKPVGIAFMILASVALLPWVSLAQNKFFATPNRGVEGARGNAQINMLLDENTERSGETASNSASITALEGRMDTAETDISDLETSDTAQDTRLDSLESGMSDVKDHARAPVTNTCHDVNAKLRWNTTNSAWECLPEGDPTVQPFAKNTLPTCSNSQLLRSDGSGLQCVSAGSNYVISESDPKVGATSSNQLCRGSGAQVVCDQPNPVGALANGKWCTSDGSQISCTSDAPSDGGGVGGVVSRVDVTSDTGYFKDSCIYVFKRTSNNSMNVLTQVTQEYAYFIDGGTPWQMHYSNKASISQAGVGQTFALCAGS